MLSFLIARDTMHQNQWLAAIEELAGHYEYLKTKYQVDQAGPAAGEDER